MAIKTLVFDYRDEEKEFFGTHELENFEITFYSNSLNGETVKEIPQEVLDNTYVISVFVNSDVNENVINSFKNLRIISTRSTGVEHIDKKTADEKNIAVINVERYGAKSVAQYTFGLILALVRKIIPASNYFLSGQQENFSKNFTGRDLSTLTLGVVGTGNIGIAVCKLARAFGMKILAYDLIEKQEAVNNFDITYTGLNTLLKEADIITLHLPYTKESYRMFSSEQFKLMKNSAYLINTSRKEIVNTKDLYEAVSKGLIAGTALDVVFCKDKNFDCANLSPQADESLHCFEEEQILKELAKLPDVIITPHIAYDTQDAVDYILEVTFIAISDCIKGGNSYRIY